MLECKFDRSLEKLLIEVGGWKKLLPSGFGVVVPNYADEFYTLYKENLRVLKEQVMLVVRDQNRLINLMDTMEKKLFKTYMDKIDKDIAPRLDKLKWSSKDNLEGFVRTFQRDCNQIYNKLKVFKANKLRIIQKCSEIAGR